MNEVVDERLMTIADLSTMLGVPIDTLYGWRHRGEGPRGYRLGRHVRYRRSSVEAWLEAVEVAEPSGFTSRSRACTAGRSGPVAAAARTGSRYGPAAVSHPPSYGRPSVRPVGSAATPP